MKKLLSILAALGLTATSASAVVACGISVKNGTASKQFKNVKLVYGKKFSDLKENMFSSTVTYKGKAVTGASVSYTFTKGKKDDEANIKAIVNLQGISFAKKESLKVVVKSTDAAKGILKSNFDESFTISASKYQAKVTKDEVANLQNDSLAMSKSLVLDKQYGLDAETANKDLKLSANNSFDLVNDSTAASLGITGTRGKANQPIYQIIDGLNNLIHKFSSKTTIPEDESTINTIGSILEKVPDYLTNNNVDGLLKLIPGALQMVAPELSKLGIGGKTIAWLGGSVGKLIKDLLNGLDLNSHIAEMINEAPKDDQGKPAATDLTWFMQQGAKALNDLGNIVFNKYPTTDEGDSSLSKFLGQEIFTKLLNKQKIDVSKSFDYTHLGLWSIDAIDDLATVISSIAIEINDYQTVDKPSDPNVKPDKSTNTAKELDDSGDTPKAEPNPQDYLFGDGKTKNEDYFKAEDKKIMAVAQDGSLTLDGKAFNISLDKTIDTIFDDITSNDSSSYGILKLTNTIFHNQTTDNGVVPNPLVNAIVYTLVDAFKFTNYHVVSKGVTEGNADMGSITTDMDFNIEDLFKPNPDPTKSNIKLGTVDYSGMGLTDAELSINTENGKFGDNVTKGIAPLLGDLLSGMQYGADSDGSYVATLSQEVAGALGMPDSTTHAYNGITVFVDMFGAPTPVAGIVSGALAATWTMLQPILDNLVFDIYYTDDKPNSLKTLSKGKVDLIPADYINNAVKHVNIFGFDIDLTIARRIISFDTLEKAFEMIMVQNGIQSDPTNPQSLLQQLAGSIDNAKTWPTYLGYMTGDALDKEIKAGTKGFTSADDYIYKDSFIGLFLNDLYDLTNNQDNAKAAIVQTSDSKDVIDVSQIVANKITSDKSDAILDVAADFADSLEGEDITPITAMATDDKVWILSNMKYTAFKNDSGHINEMDYELTLDPSSYDQGTSKVTYKITFSRPNANSKFTYSSITKVN